MLEKFQKIIKPAFAKLAADGSSNSGTPKSPIDTNQHPDYGIPFFTQETDKVGFDPNTSPLLCWDHMDHIGPAGLKTYPWFTQQPEYKNLFDQASAIKEGKLTTMNKAGKAEVAKQFIAAGDAALARFQGEEGEGGFFGALTEYEETIQQQVLAVEREEAGPARRPPGGDDACCVLL